MTNTLITKLRNLITGKTSRQKNLHDKDPDGITQELDKITKPVDSSKHEGYSSPHIAVGYGLSVGKQRSHNEDAFYAMTTMLSYNKTEFPFALYIVADGMGGHKNGEIASELAIRTVVGFILREIYTPLMSLDPEQGELSFRDVFSVSIEKANAEIIKKSHGGGTTITAVLIVGDQLTIAHVGDSRVYSVDKKGNPEALTRDHSLVKRLQELGQITPEEAAVHPQRNVLYRALGQVEAFDPEIISTQRPESGYLLVCSDGLWNIVDETIISSVIKSGVSVQDICDRLIDSANDAGGPDNITAILVEFS